MRLILTWFLLLYLFPLRAQFLRVEPPFWWSGTPLDTLEILFYGKNAGAFEVSSPDVDILRVIRPHNRHYLFVDIDARKLRPGKIHFTFRNNNRVLSYEYNIKHPSGSAHQPRGFDSGDVIYLIMPDRFANGNPSNDNHPSTTEKVRRHDPNGRHGGDLEGIIRHLDYLKDLGVTSLWLTPVFTDNEPHYSYHGYAITDHYRIDPRLGTNDDYRRLVETARRKGLKVIMDYVTNHAGLHHWWVQDPPFPQWIHRWPDDSTGFRRSGYRTESIFDPHRSHADRQSAVRGWFDRSMPDLNLEQPQLWRYLFQNAVWWIEFAGIDGLRIDTYPYNPPRAMAQWVDALRKAYPGLGIVGETWYHHSGQIALWQKESPVARASGFPAALPAVMDFTLYDAIRLMFAEKQQNWNRGMARAYENYANDFLYTNPQNIMVFAGNHDVSRIRSVLGDDFNKYRMALCLVLCGRGIPQLYYGDEIGMSGHKEQGDGYLRKDFPGGWPGDTLNAFSPGGRTAGQNQYFEFTRKLLRIRQHSQALRYGKMLHFAPQNNVYVFFRQAPDEQIMVVINNSNHAQNLKPDRFSEVLGTNATGKELLTGQMINLSGSLQIPPETLMLIRINPKP